MFFGGLFFVGCCIAGLVYGIKARGMRRWGGLLIAGIGMIGLLPVLAVAPPLDITLSSVSGTYQGNYSGYDNTLKLNKDGTFDQRIADASGKAYSNHGTWKIDQIQFGTVDFNHILLPPLSPMSASQKLKIGSFGGATVHALGGIYFNEDTNACVKRVSK